jgi:phosphoglycerate dehydrogenase-like enzyme
VDTPALIEALTTRRIRAALDVTDPEPLPEDHPLWALPEVFVTPHVAGASPKLFERAYTLVREQVRRYLAGEPLLNVVEHGY